MVGLDDDWRVGPRRLNGELAALLNASLTSDWWLDLCSASRTNRLHSSPSTPKSNCQQQTCRTVTSRKSNVAMAAWTQSLEEDPYLPIHPNWFASFPRLSTTIRSAIHPFCLTSAALFLSIHLRCNMLQRNVEPLFTIADLIKYDISYSNYVIQGQ